MFAESCHTRVAQPPSAVIFFTPALIPPIRRNSRKPASVAKIVATEIAAEEDFILPQAPYSDAPENDEPADRRETPNRIKTASIPRIRADPHE